MADYIFVFDAGTGIRQLGRNVGITVAAVDYLGNIHDDLKAPTVISEQKIAQIAEIAVTDGLTRLFDVSTFREKLKI